MIETIGDFWLSSRNVETISRNAVTLSARDCFSIALIDLVPVLFFLLTHGVLQFRPLVWRNTHPYILIDRHEDVTNPNEIEQDPNCSRTLTFYGYVRGAHLKSSTKVHLIGVGDFGITELSPLPDPLPIPDKETERTVSDFRSSTALPKLYLRKVYIS